MKKLKYALLISAIFFAGGNVFAASNGTSALPFLEMGAGARYIGMGGAGTAIANEANAIYWNPGLIAKSQINAVDFMHTVYAEETFYDYAGLIVRINDKNALGISAQYFSAGELNTFDDAGRATGNMYPYDAAVSLAYAVDIKGFGIGAGAKFIQSQIVNSAASYAFSFGVSFPDLFDGRLKTGAALTNAGRGITYDKETEKLPMGIRLGAGFYVLDNLLAAFDAGKVADSDAYAAAGIEYKLVINENLNTVLRGGYNTVAETEGLSGASAGLGIEFKSTILDYAFVPMGNIGNTHRVSVTFFW
ncbi:MAG: PorV/PorQ family protein [Endomicrobium sp.]|jgi:hypothetical protein|nr:PorV/PorQ family protein [Endomicrobium sp.]